MNGIIGIRNRGNTCFLNTSIQCLNNILPLTDYFLSDLYKNDILNESQFVYEYFRLLKTIWSHDRINKKEIIDPYLFHSFIQETDKRFTGNYQHDAQELLSLILDNLHEGLKYDVEIKYTGNPKNNLDKIMISSIENWKINLNNKYSIISNLFFGQFINKIISTKDNRCLSKTFEMFSIFTLPIFGNSLYEAFDKYTENEELETPYLNEDTKKTIPVFKQTKLMTVPQYFIISLKRYKNKDGFLIKSNNSVEFPIDNLNLSNYCEGYDSIKCELKLISIACHIGGLGGGHYYAVCRNTRDNTWNCFNDENVSVFDVEKNKDILFKHAYILIYEKMI